MTLVDVPAQAESDVIIAINRGLIRRIGPVKYGLWFSQAALIQVEGQTVRVALPSRTHVERVRLDFRGHIADAAAEALGCEASRVTVEVSVGPSPDRDSRRGERLSGGTEFEGTSESENGYRSGSHGQSAHGWSGSIDRRHSLDRFVVGASNRLGYMAALRIAESAKKDDGLERLFVHGACGLGKTHLLQGICLRYLEIRPEARIRYFTGEDFTNQYITAVRAGRLDAFRRSIRALELLVVDDVHFLSNKQSTQAEFLATFDAINLSGSRLVMASDEHPSRIAAFQERLVSRCVSGLVVEVQRPDRQTRREIVLRIAAERGLRINESGLDAIVEASAGSVREIEGLVSRVEALAMVQEGEREIGMIVVSQAIGRGGAIGRKAPRVGEICEIVCRRLGCSREEFRGDGRHKAVVLARSLAAYLSRAMTNQSYPEIARGMGRANHSTIIAASQRLEASLAAGRGLEVAAAGLEIGAPLGDLVDRLRVDIEQQT